jgi:hypothetical protein
MNPTASKEAVAYHALAKQKKKDCQDDYQQEPSNAEPGWLSPCGIRHIQISFHQSCLSAKSG